MTSTVKLFHLSAHLLATVNSFGFGLFYDCHFFQCEKTPGRVIKAKVSFVLLSKKAAYMAIYTAMVKIKRRSRSVGQPHLLHYMKKQRCSMSSMTNYVIKEVPVTLECGSVMLPLEHSAKGALRTSSVLVWFYSTSAAASTSTAASTSKRGRLCKYATASSGVLLLTSFSMLF